MTREVIDRLVAAGFEPEDATSRSALLDRASAGLASMAGEPAWRWIVPGRIELFGKHTDYGGGRSLVAAAPRGFAFVARPRSDGLVRVLDARNVELTQVDGTGPARPHRGWGTYVSAVVHRLSQNFPGAALGTDIAFASDLPRAAGVSSSSALLTGVAMALVRRGGVDAWPEFREAIATPYDRAAYFACIENGESFRTLAGARGVGTEGGSEDHTAILCARARTVSLFSYVPIVEERDVIFPADWRVVVMSSGVHADKAGTVRDRYNRASRLAGALLTIWNARVAAPARSLRAAMKTASDADHRLRDWIHEAEELWPPGTSAEDLLRRLAHFMNEDRRAELAADAIARGDLAELGTLAAASQADADRLLGNQVPATSALVAQALAAGAGAATSFGAGFGGSTWAFVPSSDVRAFTEEWRRRYRGVCPHLTNVESFAGLPAPGVIDVQG